ncbi:cytidine deaminase [Suttonella ornithocola]|uniref:Cytidine deaminase n=1 Tax=Suttonella ornithocola TaxID=279832 RepID=A0A380MT17_9GAMM|nr:cytidine deaminase [Suttonella ornithocola]SUO95063.1 Cytidine deaminase [Suttonella ornithocola]
MIDAFIPVERLPVSARENSVTLVDYALTLLEDAAQFAVVPISHFKVGAIAIDSQGNFYLGANQEYAHAAIAQTVHAEQSAIAHAWHRGAESIAHIIVNYTPCGHCRQFMNELAGAEDLLIHLPTSRSNRLVDFLPERFGPADLAIKERIFSSTQADLENLAEGDELMQEAFKMACCSYTPYSESHAGICLKDHLGYLYSGTYLENAAFNPSLPPLQMALNGLHLSKKSAEDIVAGALVCIPHRGHEAHTQALWSSITKAPLAIYHTNIAK